MGTGKSYLLAALACDLHEQFASHSRCLRPNGLLKKLQRVVYIPDCFKMILSKQTALDYVKVSLLLAYEDDSAALPVAAIQHRRAAQLSAPRGHGGRDAVCHR